MGASINSPSPRERVRHVGISDSQLDAVIAALETIDPGVDLALRGGLANLKDGRSEVSASEARPGDWITGIGLINSVEERPGAVTFRVAGGDFSCFDHHQLRIVRDWVVL
ncbi:MAG TPA: hypothetical protein VGY76_10555 [Solirubrobacteraceae bacterium]|nr:hypothetical protein [Solirubrobacteraceae bacterium]